MKIYHIVAGLSSQSGVTRAVTSLALCQWRLGHEVCIVSLTKQKSNDRVDEGNEVKMSGVKLVTFNHSWPHFLYFSWGMLLGLEKVLRKAEVVHTHVTLTFPIWWGAWLALRHKKTLVMSPHGCLDPLRLNHSWWKKKAVGWIDRWLLRHANVIHATCTAEEGWIRSFLNVKRETGNLKLETGGGSEGGGRRVEKAQKIEHSSKESPKIVVVSNGIEGPCERGPVVA